MILNINIRFRKRSILKLVLILFLIFSSFSSIYGQKTRKEDPPPLRERLFYGGYFGLQFGTITDIQISPVIGLWVLPRLAVAVGPEYRFYKYYDYRTSLYGGKTYMQFIVIRDLNSIIPLGVHTGIFLHLEDEMLSLESSYWNPLLGSGRFFVNTVLAGGGISQQIGRRSSMNFMVLWALNDSGYGIYSNPELRLSFNF